MENIEDSIILILDILLNGVSVLPRYIEEFTPTKACSISKISLIQRLTNQPEVHVKYVA